MKLGAVLRCGGYDPDEIPKGPEGLRPQDPFLVQYPDTVSVQVDAEFLLLLFRFVVEPLLVVDLSSLPVVVTTPPAAAAAPLLAEKLVN
eukprot:CAMPEP_0183320500 /NCGR_PEP_ID=MMETSP0160_2-20130417/66447_1 /TAXON_ID=2839 ORGANISM="Odontella Sinensis, Strain Grunow 1884" /NCGR_SAMPLE_ID=MMETSP0160_2 /ASSEMBLY_ACC=CAM_ASM_000250 /LENGTH=88 /DNA_ID=CAMNT_0025487197 /DNA_START=75 /DNA_END=338 /DNA_ORIENTATION=-